MMSHRTFLFAGGGSGGHLFPGVAVAEELTARDPACRIVFAGSGRGIERTVLDGTGFRHVPLSVLPPGAARRHPIRFAAGLAGSVRQSFRLIDELRPEFVIGLGGFASIPVAIAARRRRVPLVLLEQNVVPGRATSWLCRWAERVCVSFDKTRSFLPRLVPTVVTGNPLRQDVRRVAIQHAGRRSRTLLILGGSQGARGVNAMAVSAVMALTDRLAGWNVVHQTGERDVEKVSEAYGAAGVSAEVAAFFPDLPSRYADAALVVSRAGATTLAELACVGCPAVLVPYPGAVRDHQRRNAEHFVSAGGAALVPEVPPAAGWLTETLGELLVNPVRRAEMSAAMRCSAMPDAAAAVADLLLPRNAAIRAA